MSNKLGYIFTLLMLRFYWLVGAGWGGCTVSLVEEARVPEFIEKMKASYPAYHGLHGEELAEVIFATKPSAGASGE